MVLVDGSNQQLTDAAGNLLFEDGAVFLDPAYESLSSINEATPPIIPIFSAFPVGPRIIVVPPTGDPLIDGIGEILTDDALNVLIVPDVPSTVATIYQSDIMPPSAPYVVQLESFTPPPLLPLKRKFVPSEEPPRTAEYVPPVLFELLSGDLGFKSLPRKVLGKFVPSDEPPRIEEYAAPVRFELLSGNTALAPAITSGGGGTFYAVGVIVMLPKVSGVGGNS